MQARSAEYRRVPVAQSVVRGITNHVLVDKIVRNAKQTFLSLAPNQYNASSVLQGQPPMALQGALTAHSVFAAQTITTWGMDAKSVPWGSNALETQPLFRNPSSLETQYGL